MSLEDSPPLPGEAPPVLTRLLQFLGDEGLRPQVRKELHQAEASLARSQEIWFRWETLWRLLGEILRDPRDLEPSVLQELQEELTWAQVRRGHPEIAPLVPPPKRSPSLPSLLLPELERRLRENRDQLQDFLLGIPKNPPGIPKNPPGIPKNPPGIPKNPPGIPKNPPGIPKNPPGIPGIPEGIPGIPEGLLEGQKLRLSREKRRERENRERLEKARREHGEVLAQLHSQLAQLDSLRAAQEPLDGALGQHLEGKTRLLLLRARLEELQLLLDTYPAPTLEAHRRIRACLSQSIQGAESEAESLGAELAARRALGPELLPLAEELGRVRRRAELAREALGKLRPPRP
ncbi:uncharacterized protein LOC127474871 [Manacus candei]|uniref:uncharacterized protein LOC127474871 n=1 Tax=Manacus candei TaxID=415023 RepID=UPI002226EB20|nr:uncharacterized protein LOC127474871 [Manacus candei]